MCTLWPSYSAYVHLKTHAKMFTVTLFILTKIGKLKYLSVVEWSNVGMNHVQIVGFICQIVKYWQQYIFFNWYIVYINTVTTIQQCGWRFITTCNDMFIGWKFHLKNMRLAKKKKKARHERVYIEWSHLNKNFFKLILNYTVRSKDSSSVIHAERE